MLLEKKNVNIVIQKYKINNNIFIEVAFEASFLLLSVLAETSLYFIIVLTSAVLKIIHKLYL